MILSFDDTRLKNARAYLGATSSGSLWLWTTLVEYDESDFIADVGGDRKEEEGDSDGFVEVDGGELWLGEIEDGGGVDVLVKNDMREPFFIDGVYKEVKNVRSDKPEVSMTRIKKTRRDLLQRRRLLLGG